MTWVDHFGKRLQDSGGELGQNLHKGGGQLCKGLQGRDLGKGIHVETKAGGFRIGV